MQHSTKRIITTHAGSLPRPADMIEMLVAKAEGKPIDEDAQSARLPGAVKEIVRKQIELGLDVIDDGEYSKPSFVTYVNDRLAGFEPDPAAPRRGSWAQSREGLAFPEFYASAPARNIRMVCTGPVTYRGHALLQRDIANLKAAIGDADVEAFMPAISVANIEDWMLNRYYKTAEEYLYAIADAMREEYKAIVDAGFLVQIDDPRLVSYYLVNPNATIEECRKWAVLRGWWHYQSEIANFSKNLTSGHPYRSRPWGWLLMTRPIAYFYNGSFTNPQAACGAATCSQEVLAIGNPAIWWASIGAFIACFWRWLGRGELGMAR